MAGPIDYHARAIKAWETRKRAQQGGGSNAITLRDDFAKPPATVTRTGKRGVIEALLPGVTDDDLRALGCALPGSEVEVLGHADGDAVLITTRGGGVTAMRAVRQTPDGKGRYVRNVYIDIDNDLQGQGLGTTIFKAQVDAARRAGLVAITCDALRGKGVNGYYSWARMGFDGMATLNGKKIRIAEQMRTKAGRDAWLRDGDDFPGTFSLKDGSYSMRTLKAYVALKRRNA